MARKNGRIPIQGLNKKRPLTFNSLFNDLQLSMQFLKWHPLFGPQSNQESPQP